MDTRIQCIPVLICDPIHVIRDPKAPLEILNVFPNIGPALNDILRMQYAEPVYENYHKCLSVHLWPE